MTVIHTLQDFIEAFGLAIGMSLIGGLIGHFVKNGIIELPRIVIEYRGAGVRGSDGSLQRIRWWRRLCQQAVFSLGIRNRRNAADRIYFDLGFAGDLLIAVGTGILAKTALALVNTDDPYAVISTSLLAGYAGLSYMKGKMSKEMADMVIQEMPGKGEEHGGKQGAGNDG